MNLVQTIDAAAPPRTRRRGCLRAVGFAALAAATVTDLLIAGVNATGVWPVALTLAIGLTAMLLPARRRPVWLTTQVRTAAPALASAALSAGLILAHRKAAFGPAEAAVLLYMTLTAVRFCPPRWAAACVALNGVALAALPLRVPDAGDSALGILSLLVLLGAGAAGLGGYLRTQDGRRRLAVAETRRAERLAIAADLHDFVAHHVTGILVQAQMARMMAAGEPERLDPVLAGIERAATEALASMRRTVGVLRDTRAPAQGPSAPPDRADLRPVGDLAGLADLVAGFQGPAGPQAVLRRAPEVPEDLPHEVQAAAYRVAQESLTNVRRHASDAAEVTIGLAWDGSRLEVTVRDDGRGAGPALPHAARGGGFGLVGLAERVTALGGELRAGPGTGHGWEVVALLPAAVPAGARA